MTSAAKEFPCIESTCDIVQAGLVVRVWRDEESIESAVSAEQTDVRAVIASRSWEGRTAELLREIVKLPRINAVQVIRSKYIGTPGVVVYAEWP